VTLYCDSSAIVSINLRERGRHRVVQPLIEREPAACVTVGFVEVHATLARARYRENPLRLSERGYQRAIATFGADWVNYFRLPVTHELLQIAGELARRHVIRAYDAVHLAAAIGLRELVPDTVLVSTWDTQLAEAAMAEGLSLAHEVNA
jgi:predicted nucleic acid-binding protein